MIDWKRKLTSRKFWAALIGVAIAVTVAINASPETTERLVAVISSVAVLVGYMFAEGMTDMPVSVTTTIEETLEEI